MPARPTVTLTVILTAMASGAVVASCGDGGGSGSSTVPERTAIRTVPTDQPTTTLEPLVTAYPTLPPVTAAPPTWVPAAWTTDMVEHFVELVQAELDEQGVDAAVIVERGYALLSSGTRVQLGALAYRVAALPAEAWPDEVARHLLTALRPPPPDALVDFADAAPLLRVRVGEAATLVGAGITRELAPGLLAALVLDGPDRKVFVAAAEAARWGMTTTELLDLATRQTLAVPETPSRTGPYTSLTDDEYAASRVADPASLVPSVPLDGVLVIIPAADVYLAVDVTAGLDRVTVLGLARQAREEFAAAAEPASDELYWWRGGVLEVVPFDGNDVRLPTALAEVLGWG